MDSKFKANLMIFLTIAVLAIGIAFICLSMTGSFMNPYLSKFIPQKTDKLGIIADGDFSPEQIKTVQINVVKPKIENNTTVENTTYNPDDYPDYDPNSSQPDIPNDLYNDLIENYYF